MPLVFRYVDKNLEIQERFVKFIHCDSGITDQALQDKITNYLTNKLMFDVANCKSQCYDGALNMAGQYSGLATHISWINPLAIYTHFAFSTKIGNFINTPKRQLLLEQMIRKFCPAVKIMSEFVLRVTPTIVTLCC